MAAFPTGGGHFTFLLIIYPKSPAESGKVSPCGHTSQLHPSKSVEKHPRFGLNPWAMPAKCLYG